MLKIDKKDLKIYYHLIKNSRQPLSQIGKKVGLSREVVGNRIKRFEKEGVIIGYPTWINSGYLGWGLARFYYTFKFVSPKIKQEIIEYFVNNDIVTLVAELEGCYDLLINVYVNSLRTFEYPSNYRDLLSKFSSFYEQTQKKFRKYIDEQKMIAIHKCELLGPINLLGDKNLTRSSIHWPPFPIKDVQIDKLDYEILKKLAVNAKVPTVQLANDLNVTTVTIKNRIKRLIDEKVVGRFGVRIDLSKTGYRHYNIEINLNDYDKKHEIIKYVRKHQNINEIFQSFGQGVDLNFSYTLKDIKELQDKINDLSSKFPDAIKNFRYFSWEKYLKYNKVPFK